MFKVDEYVKIIDTEGNHRFGFIEKAHAGALFLINCEEEGLSKINYDEMCLLNLGVGEYKDFKNLLTASEKKMIPYLAQQCTTKTMAEALNLREVTVRTRIRELKIKLGVDTREQLFVYAQGIEKKI